MVLVLELVPELDLGPPFSVASLTDSDSCDLLLRDFCHLHPASVLRLCPAAAQQDVPCEAIAIASVIHKSSSDGVRSWAADGALLT
ncbi:hypothetical protein CCMA1212_008203 [Trichoderma ghanense]|uniref:Uncharacterized protein n=1 Tax=Trichoderma ghanense TaxID=65468 RepID=A0ABY2GX74_9HYPO